jgi:uncharacterized FlaG/YvyC family protein
MYIPASTLDPAQRAATSNSASMPVEVPTGAAASGASADAAHTLRGAAAAINRATQSLTNSLELVLDERSERPGVRQIPTEAALELGQALDRVAGLLINRTA